MLLVVNGGRRQKPKVKDGISVWPSVWLWLVGAIKWTRGNVESVCLCYYVTDVDDDEETSLICNTNNSVIILDLYLRDLCHRSTFLPTAIRWKSKVHPSHGKRWPYMQGHVLVMKMSHNQFVLIQSCWIGPSDPIFPFNYFCLWFQKALLLKIINSDNPSSFSYLPPPTNPESD